MDSASPFLRSWIDAGAVMTIDDDTLLLGWGEKRPLSSVEPSDRPTFLFYDFFLQERCPYFRYPHHQFFSRRELLRALENLPSHSVSSPHWLAPSRQPFHRAYSLLQEHFRSGVLTKAVPYIVFRANEPMTPQRRLQSIKSALHYLSAQPGYLYGKWDSHSGILGLTPELLFRQNTHDMVETVAIAGTVLSSDPAEALLDDPKQREEHQCVVKGIRESLHPFGEITIEETRVTSFGSLAHLVTPIRLHVDQIQNVENLIRCLHPTPAVGAYPKQEGAQWLFDYAQEFPRGYFGGPVGYIGPQGIPTAIYVAIRNVTWDEEGMALFAGCGIVSTSQEELEWKELQQKIASIRRIFSLTTHS